MKGGKILVVEDEEKIADIVRVYLEKEGFAVSVAGTGQKAISMIKEDFAVGGALRAAAARSGTIRS